MKIVLFTHPDFSNSQSMPRFAKMIGSGMVERGHTVEIWTSKGRFINLSNNPTFRKWLGYIDQFLIFPNEVRSRLKKNSTDILFVFCDQSLGIWVPLVNKLPHIIHCHDFLAQQSALGEIKENPTSYSGRIYQKLIRKGYQKGNRFISVSEKTKVDLHNSLVVTPEFSGMVYNGLNRNFEIKDIGLSYDKLKTETGFDFSSGYILHIGGNQWYKNRIGVIEIYDSLRINTNTNIPLLMVGAKPSLSLMKRVEESPFKADIHFLVGIQDEMLNYLYSGAKVLLFPSIAEGFGWPIAEAMASGCIVITTNEAPMTEVAGDAAFLISKRPFDTPGIKQWSTDSAGVLYHVLNLNDDDRKKIINAGIQNVKRFNAKDALDAIERIYLKTLNKEII